MGFPRLFLGLLPLFVVAHFGHHLLTALPVPLLPMIRDDFALDYTQAGLLISAFSLSYGIGQLPGGWLADRIGPHLLITMGISGVAVAGLLVGLSPTYFTVILSLVLMGLLGGGYHPASPPLISASVEPRNRGRALGFHMIGGSASFFLAPLMAAAIASAWGWRGSFIGLAIPTLIFGFIFYILLGKLGVVRGARQRITERPGEAIATPGHWRRLLSFIILSASLQAILFSTIAFIPLLMVDQFGVSKEGAAAIIALIYSTGLWAGPLAGYMSDRVGSVPMILAASFMAAPTIYLLNLAPYGWGFSGLLIALGVIMYIRMPVSESYILSHTSEGNRSTILGINYFASMEGGGVLTPVMGYLVDSFGFYPSFTFAAAAIAAITLICSIPLSGSRD